VSAAVKLGERFVPLSSDLVKRLRVELGEVTTDDIIRADIAKELMWKRTSLISVGEKVIPVRNTTNLEHKVYWTDIEKIEGEFPVPENAAAARAQPATWNEIDVRLEMAEYRWLITYWARARQWQNSQVDAMIRGGSEFFRRCVDKQILDALYAGAGATPVTVPSGEEWDSGAAAADPEGDIIQAFNNIVAESNLDIATEMATVCLIYPAKVDATLRGLKMIGNIQQSLMQYFKTAYGFQFFPTRYYSETGTEGLQDDALMVVNSPETAIHFKYTGGAIPLSRQKEHDRGIEYVTRQIFGTVVIPSAAGVTTSKRICKIENVI